MGTVRKRGETWHAEVRRRKPPFYAAASRTTKAGALAWIAQTEADLAAGKLGKAPNKPFRAALERYSLEVSPKKRGARWEVLRLALIGRDPLGDVMLPALSSTDFAAWRDRRLTQVGVASMLREWTLLRNVVTVAIDEWKWLTNNPMKGVKKPAPPPPRDRLATCEEVESILYVLGYEVDEPAVSVGQRVAVAWLLAVESAMRAGELCGLRPETLFLEARFARLPRTKNGRKRDVALSACFLALLKQLPGGFLNLTPRQIDANWRKARGQAGVEDLHFHDSRHLAITRLAKKLHPLELARMTGHLDLKQLMVYYNEPASETAGKL